MSDGLLGDVAHVLDRSGAALGTPIGAIVEWPAVPVDPALQSLPDEERYGLALCGGDDYELAFTAPQAARSTIDEIAARLAIRISRIGRIDDRAGVRLVDAAARPIPVRARSFDHFR